MLCILTDSYLIVPVSLCSVTHAAVAQSAGWAFAGYPWACVFMLLREKRRTRNTKIYPTYISK